MGVKKSTCGVALNREQFDSMNFSPKNFCPSIYMSVCPSVYKILLSVKVLDGVSSHIQ